MLRSADLQQQPTRVRLARTLCGYLRFARIARTFDAGRRGRKSAPGRALACGTHPWSERGRRAAGGSAASFISRQRFRLLRPLRPWRGAASTSQGHAYGIFQKAIQRRNVIAAVAAARELPQLSLTDALELNMLIARKDSARYPRVARRPDHRKAPLRRGFSVGMGASVTVSRCPIGA